MASPELKVKVRADLSDFDSKLKKVSSRLRETGDQVNAIGKSITMKLTAPIGLAGGASIKLASDLEESLNKVDVAFGDSASEVTKFANTTLKNFGIARGSALEMTALFGDMSTAMGFTQGEASQMSMQLTGLAGDLASFKNISVERAQTALAGVFTGETEALKGLGIIVTETALEQEAMNQGITKSVKEMTQQEKIALRLSAVMSQSANAQGDFARTSGGAANQMRIFQEGLKQIGEQIGAIILPSFTKLVTFANALISRFSALSEEVKTKIVVIGGLTASIGPALIAMGSLMKVAGNLRPAMGQAVKGLKALRKVAMTTVAPILLKVAALGALVLVAKTIYDTFEPLQTFFTKLFNNIRDKVLSFVDKFAKAFTFIRDKIAEIFPKLVEGAETQLERFNNATEGKAGEFKDNFIENIQGAVDGAQGLFGAFVDSIGGFMDQAQANADSAGPIEIDVKPKVSGEQPEQAITSETRDDFLAGGDFQTAGPVDVASQEDINQARALEDRMASIQMVTGMARQAFTQFGQAVANSLTQAIMQGEKFGDVLKNLLKQLASQALQKFLTIALTGGAGGFLGKIGGGIFGEGGGLFGKIGGALFGGAKMAEGGVVPRGFPNDTYPALLTSGEMVVPKPHALPSMSGAVEVFGEFRVRGSDLVTAISNTNNRTLR